MAKRHEKAREYTKKYKELLLPCKYCGCTDIEIQSDRTVFDPKDVWDVCCTECGNCVCLYTSVLKAVDRWNETNRKE